MDWRLRERNIVLRNHRNKRPREAVKIYGAKEIKKLARNLPETAPVVGDDDYKKLKRKLNNNFLQKGTSITPGIRLTSKNRSQERVLSHTRATARKIKGLRVWRANIWQNTGTLDANHQGQRARYKKYSEEMEPRSLPWGRKPISKSKIWKKISRVRRFSTEEWQVGIEEETRRRNHRDLPENEITRKKRKRKAKLLLLWKDRSTPSRPKLPSIWTTVFKVWQVQTLCVMLQNRCLMPRGLQGDQESTDQENNRGWGNWDIEIEISYKSNK